MKQKTKHYKESHDNLNYLQEYKHAIGKAREIIAKQVGERLKSGSQENQEQLQWTGAETALGEQTYISGAINKNECDQLSCSEQLVATHSPPLRRSIRNYKTILDRR